MVHETELKHTRQLSDVDKHATQLANAVNRFKDGITQLLYNEDMANGAENMKNIQPVTLDQVTC